MIIPKQKSDRNHLLLKTSQCSTGHMPLAWWRKPLLPYLWPLWLGPYLTLSTPHKFTPARPCPAFGWLLEHHLCLVPPTGSLLRLHVSAEMSLDPGSLLWPWPWETGLGVLPLTCPNIMPLTLLFSCLLICLLTIPKPSASWRHSF